ncbi:MAG: helix-turn-helix domain-containing protein [Micrococcales bacterium]|nr:helix-turn-helix domain-containing protein [Micrococcales bacterium]MCL2666849.1 helix-turn-helix domain-containing protein [Micrococcales bacterium]
MALYGDTPGGLMQVLSILDMQSAIRGRRHELGLTQQALADRAGISRKWLVAFETGVRGPAVELAVVMRVLAALDLRIDLAPPQPDPQYTYVDLDEHLANLAPKDSHG